MFFLRKRSVSGWRKGPGTVEYVINLFGASWTEVHINGKCRFWGRNHLPLIPHCAISANSAISPVFFKKNNNNSTGVVGDGWDAIAARPGHVHCPKNGQSSRRPNGHSRSFALESKSDLAPQSPGTRALPRGSLSSVSLVPRRH